MACYEGPKGSDGVGRSHQVKEAMQNGQHYFMLGMNGDILTARYLVVHLSELSRGRVKINLWPWV